MAFQNLIEKKKEKKKVILEYVFFLLPPLLVAYVLPLPFSTHLLNLLYVNH